MKEIIFTQEELAFEEWRDVIGYDYKYQISDLGRFRRITAFHKKRIGIITTGSITKGYLRVNVVKAGKSTSKKVHRLVAEYFLEGYSEKLTINHKDFIKTNNRKTNLGLMTVVENTLDFIIKVKKESSSSKCLGVSYHKQIGKWTTRVNIGGDRKSLGVFDTKEEAEHTIQNYKDEEFREGKGVFNKGIRKYTEKELTKIKESLKKVGFRKTRVLFSIGSSTLKLIKDNEYYDTRN